MEEMQEGVANAGDHNSSSYKFLVSSDGTGSSLKKTKRRRTSPQDHVILEAAYQKNSKPDKADRAHIVSQVQLGEKEVQIWFQNRRQNDRRRSKPLQPHELMPYILNPHTYTHVPSKGAEAAEASQTLATDCSHPHAQDSSSSHPTPTPSPINDFSPAPRRGDDSSTDMKLPSPIEGDSEQPVTSTVSSLTAIPTPSKIDQPSKVQVDKKSTPTSDVSSSPGSARKRDHDAMIAGQATVEPVAGSAFKELPAKTKEPLKRSTSVRLAMTVDGAVKVRMADDPISSPVRPRALPSSEVPTKKRIGLGRSQSLFTETDLANDTTRDAVARGTGARFGRSRDARTWEFYCDTSAGDALAKQAEAERNGSAVGAINLIRSHNHKGRAHAMSPADARGNVRLSSTTPATAKPKFSRAQTSLARLQSPALDSLGEKPNKPYRLPGVRSPSDDSDKENWAPGTRNSNNPLRRTEHSTNQRPILHDADSAPSRGLVRIPTSGIEAVSARKNKAQGEDFDCIQGLLSLSQGAWR